MFAPVSETRAICFQLLDSVLTPKSCAYVAGPLSSGKFYYESAAAGVALPGSRDANEARLRRFAEQLRRRLPYPVFDPGRLKIEGWTGSDYHAFFLEIVGRYAREVWFIDDWQFSHGATREFVFCCNHSIPCLDESGHPLTYEKGKTLIEGAAAYIESLGLDGSRLRSRLAT